MSETQIKGLVFGKKGPLLVDIFAYASHGLPGIEVIGLGTLGRKTKEKFVYLSKTRQLKMPMRRYLLCVEWEEEKKDLGTHELSWLELPLLICFWSLSGHLPIKKLNDCVASGKVSIHGKVQLPPLNSQVLNCFKNEQEAQGPKGIKFLYEELTKMEETLPILEQPIYYLSTAQLFSSIPKLEFYSTVWKQEALPY